MKKFIFFILIEFAGFNSNGQDIVNWYQDFEGQDWADYQNNYIAPIIWGFQTITQNYNGEYTLVARDLPWIPDQYQPNLQHLFTNHTIFVTHEIEVVSFPFAPTCTFVGCTGTSNREMRMPQDPFQPFANAWVYSLSSGLNRSLLKSTQEAEFEPNGTDWVSTQTRPTSLASKSFTNIGNFADDRDVLPQTILKHTLRLRCNPISGDGIISTIVFYTDLTRGIMQEYPFTSTNSYSSAINHDITIKPSIVSNSGNYNATDICLYGESMVGVNCSSGWPNWIGDAIDYTPFHVNDDDNLCLGLPTYGFVQSAADIGPSISEFHDNTPGIIMIPDHSLIVSTGVRDWRSDIPCGYELQTSNTFTRLANHPFVHEYFIDQNIDLRDINQTEKIIFNPAEVHVTCDNLVFPENYTFKTISGKYPYLPTAIAQNTPENGGPYNTADPLDPNYISHLNTQTDLFKDWHNSNTMSFIVRGEHFFHRNVVERGR